MTFAKEPQTSAEQLAQLIQLNPETELTEIAEAADQLARSAKAENKETKTSKADKDLLADLPFAELQERLRRNPDHLSKREIRGVETAAQIAREALQLFTSDRSNHLTELREVLAGLENNRRPTVPRRIGVITPWRLLIQNSHRSIGSAESEPASDEQSVFRSGLWSKPSNIAAMDLYTGFDRAMLPRYSERIWNYDGPKTSAGTRPGFEIRSGGIRLKAKLAEASSEPFTARMFDALGYHVDVTDYAEELKVRYNRRLFREFNLRKPLTMHLRPFWIPLGALEVQPDYDPFAFVKRAVFKDGKSISGAELKARLLISTNAPHPEIDAKNFCPEIEAALDYIVVGPVNLQPKEEPAEPIGCWDFANLGHENVRELRSAGLLAAWLGWFDSRFDNTQIRLGENQGQRQLLFYFTDLGSGMGGGGGWMRRHGEDANGFEWTFSAPRIVRGPGQMTTPFRVKHFETIVPTPAFQNMTEEDARWMARLIAQLSEAQISAALIASGYDSAEAKLYLEKLISRRDQMLRDLGLESEFPLFRAESVDRKFSYAPAADGDFKTKRPSGEIISARRSAQIVRDGKLQ